MQIHLAAGEEGCRLAVELGATAVIVDALRASATAAALLENGAPEICAVREVGEALAMKAAWPDALLFGERGGLPPPGFDYGNSPREAIHARGRRVVFTTTTGAGRLLSAWGAAAVIMGSTVNRAAVVRYIKRQAPRPVVLVPAGLTGDPGFDALEDWTAAACIASGLAAVDHATWGTGRTEYELYRARIEAEGIERLFRESPHAEKLRKAGLEADIDLCARCDCYRSLPVAVRPLEFGLLLRDGAAGEPNLGAWPP